MFHAHALGRFALTLALTALGVGAASAAPLPVVSVTTTATLVNNAGGALSPSPALVDGNLSGAAGTFVEFHVSELPGATFDFQFNQPYDVREFKLWNDRGAADSGIDAFRLHFFNSSSAPIGSTGVLNASSTFQGNNTTPEVFSLGTAYSGAQTVQLEVLSGLTMSHVQFREVAFCGVPEPSAAAAALLGLCSVATVGMRHRLG